MKYFIDTCIWRDFYEDRFSKTGRPLGKYACGLFMRILKNKDQILLSSSIIRELKQRYTEEEIFNLLTLLIKNRTIVRIETTKSECLEARRLSLNRDIPYIDCLNAIQARNHKALLISQDRHFDGLSDIVKVIKP